MATVCTFVQYPASFLLLIVLSQHLFPHDTCGGAGPIMGFDGRHRPSGFAETYARGDAAGYFQPSALDLARSCSRNCQHGLISYPTYNELEIKSRPLSMVFSMDWSTDNHIRLLTILSRFAEASGVGEYDHAIGNINHARADALEES